MWDQRYSAQEYVYGKEPNDFLVSVASEWPPGRVLCLGEGEGRNAVWLAQRGFAVTAVDASTVGLAKARRLAGERGVAIETIGADLARFVIEPGHWDAVVSIFCHLPAAVRAALHRRVVAGLRSGGRFVLEAYTPRQLQLGTGGPPVLELMMDLQTLRAELAGLDLAHAVETEREIQEGQFHHGVGAVVQILARKP